MARLARNSIVLALLFPLVCMADRIEAWSDAAVQTTCEKCFFPNPLAVFVYDDLGRRKPNTPVTFTAPSLDLAFIPNAGAGPYTVLTDSSGTAVLPYPGLVTAGPGSFTVRATSPGAPGEARFDLTVDGSPPTRIEFASAMNLSGAVGQVYEQRFIVQAFGADGQPRPNAAVLYLTVPGANGASGNFENGGVVGYGQAALFGQAVPSIFRANEIPGRGEILAMTFNPDANRVVFGHYNSALAASLEPLAGATPQSTRQYAAFPREIGAVARDALGNPVKDVAVRFTTEFLGEGGYGYVPNLGNDFYVLTGADGTAVMPQPYVGVSVGGIPFTASAPGLPTVRYALEVLPGPPTALQQLAGNNQRAIVNTPHPQRWSVRAMGDDGLPVPYAVIHFFADPREFVPSGRFGAANALFVVADASGVATAPAFTANGVVGRHFGSASTMYGGGPFMFFHYENVTADLNLEFVPFWPTSVAAGSTTWAGFRGRITNALGQPATGAPFRFLVDPTCGSFGGSASHDGIVDVHGFADSPFLTGIAPDLACEVALVAPGASSGASVEVHVFDAANLVLTAVPAELELHVDGGLEARIWVEQTADGRAVVHPATIIVTTAPTGATGTITRILHDFAGGLRFDLAGNRRPGTYEVIVQSGPATVVIPVRQRMGR